MLKSFWGDESTHTHIHSHIRAQREIETGTQLKFARENRETIPFCHSRYICNGDGKWRKGETTTTTTIATVVPPPPPPSPTKKLSYHFFSLSLLLPSVFFLNEFLFYFAHLIFTELLLFLARFYEKLSLRKSNTHAHIHKHTHDRAHIWKQFIHSFIRTYIYIIRAHSHKQFQSHIIILYKIHFSLLLLLRSISPLLKNWICLQIVCESKSEKE